MIRSLSIALLLVALAPAAFARPYQADPETLDWERDLQVLADTLLARHPKLSHGEPRARFTEAVDRAQGEVRGASRTTAILALARVVAAVGDGHTQLGLGWDPAIGFRPYPIRLYWFSDGLYVTATAHGGEAALGGRVEAIGNASIDEAIERIRPIVHGDNAMTFRDVAPSRLALAEILTAHGLADENGAALFRIRTRTGDVREVRLEPAEGDELEWTSARAAEPPLWQQERGNYWFSLLDNERAIYLQYRVTLVDESEDLENFSQRLTEAVETHDVERIIVDIRANNGGDNTTYMPLLRALIRLEPRLKEGLYAIIGRLTFSAAVNFAADLERLTSVRFLGEPTGAPPNHYGETNRLVLPYSGITVLYSSLYWQSSRPDDPRPWIAPNVPAELSFEDWRTGRDPALAAALD